MLPLLVRASFAILLQPPVRPSSPSLPAAHTAALRQAEAAHALDVCRGQAAWALGPEEPVPHARLFTEGDFVVGSRVEPHLAGPDAPALREGSSIHVTTRPVLSAEECDRLVADAQGVLAARTHNPLTYGQGQGDTLYAAPEVERRCVHVRECHSFCKPWLKRKLRSTFFPLLASRYGVAAADLVVYDALLVGYDATANATRLPAHRDSALMTVNVVLSEDCDYEGGGTLIEASGDVVRMRKGHALCHASGVRHAGSPITKGTRWVLVLFVISRNLPQLAWRCAERAAAAKAEARAAMREQRAPTEVLASLDEAAACLGAAANLAPRDHEVLYSLATLHDMRGDGAAARACARAAAEAYPPCAKPRLALGAMLLGAGRSRGALRQYEAALATLAAAALPEEDDIWEAWCNGGLAVIRLLQLRGVSPTPLPTATAWLHRALAAAPGDQRLLQLLDEAEELRQRQQQQS